MREITSKRIGIDMRLFSKKSTGIGRHIFELVTRLALLDTKNEYVLFLRPEVKDTFPLPGKNFSFIPVTAKHYSLSEQTFFVKELYKQNIDLMVFPHFNVPLLYRRPFVTTIHDLTLHFFPGEKKKSLLFHIVYRVVMSSAVKRAKHCFAVSAHTKNDIIKTLKVPGEKITVTYNGVSDQFFPEKNQKNIENFQKKYALPKEYFLYTGVFRQHKNILGLLRAYTFFRKRFPKSSIALVLAGPSENVDQLKLFIEKNKLEKSVFFSGPFFGEDLRLLFCGATAFLFPSFYEGFGLPVVEAMRCGIPVVASSFSVLPEVCSGAAEFFDPYAPDEMANAIERVAFQQPLRMNLIERGYKRAEDFSWKEMTYIMFHKYQEILHA
jgi:glycosyltransferase involved in cell wall biosynthesis